MTTDVDLAASKTLLASDFLKIEQAQFSVTLGAILTYNYTLTREQLLVPLRRQHHRAFLLIVLRNTAFLAEF